MKEKKHKWRWCWLTGKFSWSCGPKNNIFIGFLVSSKGSNRKAQRGGEPSVISTNKYIKSQHVGLQPVFVIKPFLAGVKRSPTVPSLKALAVLFSVWRIFVFVFVFANISPNIHVRIRIRLFFSPRIYSYLYSPFFINPNIFIFVFILDMETEYISICVSLHNFNQIP